MAHVTEAQRKATAVFLTLFVVVIIFLGMRGIVKTVRAPFDLPFFEEVPSGEELLNRALQTKDTDEDGLSDYDELNLYATSPYLADSDSDGINDKEEVEKGGDPNCPGTENCSGAFVSPQDTETEPLGSSPGGDATLPNFSALKGVLPANPTAEEIRELLRGAGLSDADINKLSDEELIELYRETLNATSR